MYCISYEVTAPLNIITGCTTFSSNNCSQMLPEILYQSVTSLWRNFSLPLQNCLS
uniref:Uncharacterized protein n=1 Tax=Anguilla anguilla TaxID=7936 RepID=A0A0E9RMQ0_ANGAN